MPRSPHDSDQPDPSVSHSLETVRLASMLRVLRKSLWIVASTALAVAVLGLLTGDRNAAVAGGVLAVFVPPLFWFVKRGHAAWAMTAAVTMVLLVACYVLIAGDGVHDVGSGVFTAVVMLAALLLSRRGSQVIAVLAIVAQASIGVAELTRVLQTQLSRFVELSDVVVPVLLLIGIAWLMQAIADTLFRSLQSAYLNQQTYREIFNATSDGILILEPKTGGIADANASALHVFGASREQILRMTPDDLAAGEPDQSGARVLELLQETEADGPRTIEWRAGRADGSLSWLEITLRAATVRGEPRVIASVRDITDRKAAEERVLAVERLQAVGQLAGGVAHDFNNQLAVILANAELLRERCAHDPASRARIEAIVQCSQRSAELTRQLLAFARKRQPMTTVVDVDALIREVIGLLQHGLDKRIEVAHTPDRTSEARVKGDPGLLQNALLNLGLNARDAMPAGGRLTFETEHVRASELSPAMREACDREASCFVRVRVRDTGSGMEPAVVTHLFEPFFTTKPHGSGLGLAATYGTVRAHGGSIDVSTQVGSGTTFDVLLPVTEEAVARVDEQASPGSEVALRVLLAEDEPALAGAMQATLRSFGCEVTWCADGQAALDRFREDPARFDLAMLDHTMPRMTGRDLASRLRELQPSLPIIAPSGFGEPWLDADITSNTVFLPKPSEPSNLRAATDTLTRRALA